MDDLDKAKDLEMQQRADAIKEALAQPDHSPGEMPIIIDGTHYCIDCLFEIPVRRLEVRPDALRCVDCKEDWEKNNK